MHRLETVVNVCIVSTCVLVLWVIVGRPSVARAPKEFVSPSTSFTSTFQSGEDLPFDPRLGLTETERTLLVFVRDGCRYCQQSAPFYQSLSERVRLAAPHSARMVLISLDSQEVANKYALDNHLDFAAIVHFTPAEWRKYRIFGTPTLMLTDRAGRIKKVWVGQLDKAGEFEASSGLLGS